MSYREHPPPPALAPWVQCSWQRSGDGGPPVRVVPDGCIDVVWIEGSGTQVVGPNTEAFLVSLPSGTRVAGVRLHPGAAPGLLGVDAAGLCDARVPVDGVWGDGGTRLAEALDATAGRASASAHDGTAPRDDRQRELLLAALAARVPAAAAPDPLVRAAVTHLVQPHVAVAAVARELAVSERQLRRRFERAVGYGPKRLARVLRLGRALAAIYAGDELARVALDAGYADQAHFTHECRSLTGVAPSALLPG
jgi:AraC-like DNA-binding protein